MKKESIADLLSNNSYPGRGIILGKTPDGMKAVIAYFIMGRSANSRNRVFVTDGEGIRTEASEPEKMKDPSLVIYAPMRVLGNKTIVTNGDQTDTIYERMDRQMTFEQSLRTRVFEPDAPHHTPRISGIVHVENGTLNYALSIIKTSDGDPAACDHFMFAYNNPLSGEGHFLHTYLGDGDPLPSYEGEPKRVDILDGIDEYTDLLWKNLDEKNKVALFVRYISLFDRKYVTRIINKNKPHIS